MRNIRLDSTFNSAEADMRLRGFTKYKYPLKEIIAEVHYSTWKEKNQLFLFKKSPTSYKFCRGILCHYTTMPFLFLYHDRTWDMKFWIHSFLWLSGFWFFLKDKIKSHDIFWTENVFWTLSIRKRIITIPLETKSASVPKVVQQKKWVKQRSAQVTPKLDGEEVE